MLKYLIPFLLITNILHVNAQDWSVEEISRIQQFSISNLKAHTDPSNKYTNNASAIELGRALFNDKRMSSNGKVSCSSCHIEEHAFTDNKKIALGLRAGFRNTSTLFNVAFQEWFFADGLKDSLWAQALSSIENPNEQNFTRVEVMQLIMRDKDYREQYIQTFKETLPKTTELEVLPMKAGPNAKLDDVIQWKKLNKQQRHQINLIFSNIGKAIASYVATIRSKQTRFDRFIGAIDTHAQSKILSESEKRGLRLFMSQDSGCTNCHSGPIFSNKSFHNIETGIPGIDNGRSEIIDSVIRDEFNCLSKYSDAHNDECKELKYVNRNKHQLSGTYKTSSLRGIAKTAPYMHDGRFATLNEVIDHYVKVSQKKPKHNDLSPLSFTEQQKTDLVNFLLTL